MATDYAVINQKTWLSVDEIASYLGLKPNTIYHLVSERRIPAHHIPNGNGLRFKKAEIDEWMEKGRIETREQYFKRSHKRKGSGNGAIETKTGPGEHLGT